MAKPVFFAFIVFIFLFCGCSKQEMAGTGQPDYAQTPETAASQGQDLKAQKKEDKPEEIIHNPFLTDEENKEFLATPSAIPIENLELSAVVYSQDSLLSRAVINGMVVKTGETVDNKTITRIDPESVRLKDEQGEYIIRMRNK